MTEPNAPKTEAAAKSSRGDELVERLRRAWQAGHKPDVHSFVAKLGKLSLRQLVGILLVDQRARWQAGERVLAESYLQRHAELAADPDHALDLLYGEFLLREHLGERPGLDEYRQRFPQHADMLQAQVELHVALAAENTEPENLRPLRDLVGDGTTPPWNDDSHWATHKTDGVSVPTGVVFPKLPATFGRYRITDRLGQGGMGEVYLAVDSQLERRVALKVPRFSHRDGPLVVDRFYREARLAATFTHPHLCPVYDVGQINNIHYLTMPFLEGEPLSALLKREGCLPQRRAAELAGAIAEAVQIAHGAGIIHRDLKPANVMINRRGEPIVMDFGLARRETPHEQLTDTGCIVGTPGYLAPEQITQKPDELGPGCDIYSLGVILYEMLAGRLPFSGTYEETLAQVARQTPQPPGRLRHDLDPRLERICLTALAKDPKSRFASMATFAAALRDCVKPGDATVRIAQPPAPPSNRRKRGILIGGIAGISALLLLLVLWQPWKKGETTTPPAPGGSPISGGKSERDPDAAEARMKRAWKLNDSGSYDAAIAECNAALQLDDRCVLALLGRVYAHIQQNRLPLAHADLDRILEIDPQNHMAYVDRAWAFNSDGDHKKAREAATKAIELSKDSAEAHYQRAEALHGLGMYQEAVSDATKAIELRPQYSWAFYIRGQAYTQLGKKDLAAKDQAKARELGVECEADAFQTDTSWRGRYRFTRQFTNEGTVHLRVTRLAGEVFEGEYWTSDSDGDYKWRVKGTMKNGKLDFGFIEWLTGGGDSKGLVGQGRVTGNLQGEKMKLLFVDPRDGSEATMELKAAK